MPCPRAYSELVIPPMLPGKPSKVQASKIILITAKTIRADLMSVVQLVQDGVAPPPVEWAFMSLSFGWIAHADIHTEPLRYILYFFVLTVRFMGDARFTAGIVWQMASRAKYESSLAVHTPLFDDTLPWWQQEVTNRKQLKESIIQHYNDEYARGPYSSKIESRGSSMDTLVGSKRPPEHWEQKGYKDMLSFYAGKVIYHSPRLELTVASLDIQRCHGISCCSFE